MDFDPSEDLWFDPDSARQEMDRRNRRPHREEDPFGLDDIDEMPFEHDWED